MRRRGAKITVNEGMDLLLWENTGRENNRRGAKGAEEYNRKAIIS
jgi:hypothetical protein